MDSDKNGNVDEIKEKDSGCGPGCSCGNPAGNNKIKCIVILIVVLAVCGIFIYKAKTSASKQANADVTVAGGFNSIISSTSASDSEAGVQSPAVSLDISTSEKSISENEGAPAIPTARDVPKPAVNADEGKKMIGTFLESFSSLNKVALNEDGVFIFIPGKDDKNIKKDITDAVAAAEKTLKTNGVAMGLYTLKTDSTDYSTISKQVQVPGLVVAVKGRGMGIVTGEITEEKLLQTFVACINAGGGCGSGGCGPTAPGCN